jgi:hypothetical protein
VRLAGLWVDLIPPSQTHQPAASYVLEVVEVEGEEDDGQDEDEDEVAGEPETEYVDQEACC